MLAARDEAKPR